MRTIAHISDLHFGRTSADVVVGLRQAIVAAKPDLVVVSGDLTQRARSHEFQQARAFLTSLPQPQIVVPGNHDVPLYNVLARWLRPLANYRRHIGDETNTFHSDGEIAVVGINSARALSFKNGRINSIQADRACARFSPLSENIVRMVVTHHPFSLPQIDTPHRVIGRAKMALTAFAACKVDVVLSGHLHASGAGFADTMSAGAHAALLVQAGTATSSRTRHEPNAFNVLLVENPYLTIQRHIWNGRTFTIASSERFRRHCNGWVAEPSAGPAAPDIGTKGRFPH